MSLQLIISMISIALGLVLIISAFKILKNLNKSVFEANRKSIPSPLASITGKMHKSFDCAFDSGIDQGLKVIKKDDEYHFFPQGKFSEQSGLNALNK